MRVGNRALNSLATSIILLYVHSIWLMDQQAQILLPKIWPFLSVELLVWTLWTLKPTSLDTALKMPSLTTGISGQNSLLDHFYTWNFLLESFNNFEYGFVLGLIIKGHDS